MGGGGSWCELVGVQGSQLDRGDLMSLQLMRLLGLAFSFIPLPPPPAVQELGFS